MIPAKPSPYRMKSKKNKWSDFNRMHLSEPRNIIQRLAVDDLIEITLRNFTEAFHPLDVNALRRNHWNHYTS